VYQSEQPPLYIHFSFRAQGEAMHALLHADVRKDRVSTCSTTSLTNRAGTAKPSSQKNACLDRILPPALLALRPELQHSEGLPVRPHQPHSERKRAGAVKAVCVWGIWQPETKKQLQMVSIQYCFSA
jgi:hypothetical protein